MAWRAAPTWSPWDRQSVDWREFAAAVLGHILSWPVVVLLLFLLFRKPVGELIQRVKRVEVAGQVVDFDQSLGRATELSAASVALAEDEKRTTAPEPDRLAPQIEPTASIVMSWERLAANIRHLHGAAGLEPKPQSSVLRLAGDLGRVGLVNDTFVAAVRELSLLRNAVAHGEHLPDVDEATRYASAAEELAHAAELFISRQVHTARRRAVRVRKPESTIAPDTTDPAKPDA